MVLAATAAATSSPQPPPCRATPSQGPRRPCVIAPQPHDEAMEVLLRHAEALECPVVRPSDVVNVELLGIGVDPTVPPGQGPPRWDPGCKALLACTPRSTSRFHESRRPVHRCPVTVSAPPLTQPVFPRRGGDGGSPRPWTSAPGRPAAAAAGRLRHVARTTAPRGAAPAGECTDGGGSCGGGAGAGGARAVAGSGAGWPGEGLRPMPRASDGGGAVCEPSDGGWSGHRRRHGGVLPQPRP